jgi:hypothetical protein
MKHFLLFALAAALSLGGLGVSQAQQKTMTASTTKKYLPKHDRWAHFTPRASMKAKTPLVKAALPKKFNKDVPATVLPVDGSGSRTVSCPTYGNDQYGDCGEAMGGHTIGILSFAQGKRPEILYQDSVLISQYLRISGGDNGMDEDMEVGPQGIFTVGVGGNPKAVAVDSMDVDPTNVALVQYLLDQFYTLQLAWSVPDAFLNDFHTGASYLQPMRPDPANGHYTTISDVTAAGNYTLWTWGGWCEVSQSFIASVEPSYFVVFSPVQFDPATGYDGHGRHVSDQAAKWVAVGGNAQKVAAVVSQFPPPNAPPVPPGPPANTISFTIPAQTIPGQTLTFTAGWRTFTTTTSPYTLPAQTITVPLAK